MSKLCDCHFSTVCERFESEIRTHSLTVAHKQGLYQHFKARPARGSSYWFDIITVPGSLIFRGDGESFVFACAEDMLAFFRHDLHHGKIHTNLTYWAEKITSERSKLKVYSSDRFKARLMEYAEEEYVQERYPGIVADLKSEFGDEFIEFEDESEARYFAENYQFGGHRVFSDVWEMDFTEYDWWYQWACHAILWAIHQHDKIYSDGRVHDVNHGTDITASLV